MSRKVTESYLRLQEAKNALEKGPQCADPQYRDLFFIEPQVGQDKMTPSQLQRAMRVAEVDAKIICDFCPIKAECLEYAITAKEEYGIWGSTTPADRRAIYAFAKGNKPELPAVE